MAQKPDKPSQTPIPTTSSIGTVPTGLIPLDDASADRLREIAEAAYGRAQQRNFAPGNDLEDWLAAEKQVDAQLKPGRPA
jgi:hypothetical protein